MNQFGKDCGMLIGAIVGTLTVLSLAPAIIVLLFGASQGTATSSTTLLIAACPIGTILGGILGGIAGEKISDHA